MNIINVFTVSFGHLNASLFNKKYDLPLKKQKSYSSQTLECLSWRNDCAWMNFLSTMTKLSHTQCSSIRNGPLTVLKTPWSKLSTAAREQHWQCLCHPGHIHPVHTRSTRSRAGRESWSFHHRRAQPHPTSLQKQQRGNLRNEIHRHIVFLTKQTGGILIKNRFAGGYLNPTLSMKCCLNIHITLR